MAPFKTLLACLILGVGCQEREQAVTRDVDRIHYYREVPNPFGGPPIKIYDLP